MRAERGRKDISDSGNLSQKGSRSFAAFITGFDWVQIIALLFLLGVGLIFIHSTGVQVGTKAASLFFQKQFTQWIPLGVGMWVFFSLLDYRRFYFRFGGVLFFILTTAALVLVLYYGEKVYGARRWLMIGSFRMQPSEFGKMSLILILAWLFSSKYFNGSRWCGIVIGVITVMVPALLIYKEPDLGGTLILFPIAGAMIFVSGLKWRWLLVTAVIGCAAFFALRALVLAEDPPADKSASAAKKHAILKKYQKKRLEVFFKPNTDISNSGHNVYQSRLAVGSGGLLGKGIGNGTQNQLGFLPQTVSNNDFIFSVIAEETGLVGAVILLGCYALLLYSILRTAANAPPYGKIIATGIGVLIFCHVYINIGMCIGLAPVTGLPLPFVSYGGSFMIVGMMAMGIMQSIYRHNKRP